MTPPEETRERLFHAAVELSDPDQRRAFLDAACGEDAELRGEVEDLLRHDDSSGGFLVSNGIGEVTQAFEPLTEGPGTQVGPYKLL